MELKLEIKLASVEELAEVAKALTGLSVDSVETKIEAPTSKAVKPTLAVAPDENEEEMEEVESPYTAHPSEGKNKPLTAAEKKAAEKAKKEEEKQAKKAQEEQEKAERIARLKAQMEQDQANIAAPALAKVNATPAVQTEEDPNAIVAEIAQLGDQLQAFQGITVEAKQALVQGIVNKLGVQGIRPTLLQQPQLGQFRDMFKAAVTSTINPVMGGLV